MPDTSLILGAVVGPLIQALAAGWVWRDASLRKRNVEDIRPILWAVLVLFLGLIALLLYLLRSRWSGPDRVQEKTRSQDLVLWGIAAAFAAVVLSMVVVWHLAARYSAFDNESYSIGTLAFLVVVFFDLLLLPPLAWIKAQEVSLRAAVLWSTWFVLGGLLAASSLVGGAALLIWLGGKISPFLPSWVGDVVRVLYVLVLAINLFNLFKFLLKRWRADRVLRDDQAQLSE